MKTTDAITLLEDALQKHEEQGTTSIELAAVRQYATKIREWQDEDEKSGSDEPSEIHMERYRAQLTAWVERYKLEHDRNMEMFRSTIQAGQNALRTCLLINGGAAVALLAFLGHVASGEGAGASMPMVAVARALAFYVAGVLIGGLASGFTYLAQFFFSDDWNKTGHAFNTAAILSGLLSLGLFGYGSYLAYVFFTAL
jgi:hypothetical protein